MAKPGDPKQTEQSERKGLSDEVDASKGIFPPDVPHPKDAETRMAGELGGGPYEESGRSSLEGAVEAGRHEPAPAPVFAGSDEAGSDETGSDERERAPTSEAREARGSLPPHRESRPSAPA